MTSKQSASKAAASKPAAVILAPHLMRRRREQVDDWLHANGVDPSVVSHDHAIHVEGDTIRYRAFDLDAEGRPVVDHEVGEVVTVERTARCTRPAPGLTPSDIEAG